MKPPGIDCLSILIEAADQEPRELMTVSCRDVNGMWIPVWAFLHPYLAHSQCFPVLFRGRRKLLLLDRSQNQQGRV